MKYTISYESDPRHQDIQILYDGLKEHMIAKRDLKPISFFGYFIKDENDNIVGGCNGCFIYGCLVVDTLWVAESLRGQGYGTKLMQKAECIGMENECHFMTVNTMDWEALDFYKKLGFTVEFERKGFDKDSIFYFLRKDLT
ncbi:MAG: GNAT family N-acetyltransferase [Gammaproteobacteria bacterium]|nr:GNAT family N-acetyltransferase [Gammaproteobacteria bacterium]